MNFSDAVWALLFLVIVALTFEYWYITAPIGVAFLLYRIGLNIIDTPQRREKLAQNRNWELYDQVRSRFPFQDQEDYDDKFVEWAKPLYKYLGSVPDQLQRELVSSIASIYDAEFFQLVPEPPAIANSIEGGRYRDTLAKLSVDYSDIENKRHRAQEVLTKAIGQLKFPSKGEYIADVPFSDADSLTNFITELFRYDDIFSDLKRQLQENADDVDEKKFIRPNEYTGDNLNYTYLKNTPLLDVFDSYVPFHIDPSMRFEHMHLVAPPGSGKSNAIKSFLQRDLDKVASGKASVIVMESNVDLIREVRYSKRFAEGGDLHGKLVVIDAEDVDYPLSINLLDLGVSDAGLSRKEQVMLRNASRNMLEYVFRSLLGTELTARQTTLYRQCITLLEHIDKPTLYDLLKLLTVPDAYYKYYDQLDSSGRDFFTHKFEKEFARTRTEVSDRIYSLLNSPVKDIITAPTTKLNMYKELGEAKVILVNAASGLLQDDGAELFGRVFIALTLMGLERRQFDDISKRLPVYFYIDECHDFIGNDERIERLLAQARKLRCGMTLAHQNLSQLKTSRDAVVGNTAIKWNREGKHLPDFTFSASFRGSSPIPLKVPLVQFERSFEPQDALIASMRKQYSYQPVPDDIQATVYEEDAEIIEGQFTELKAADEEDNPPFVKK